MRALFFNLREQRVKVRIKNSSEEQYESQLESQI